jgi:sterol desaturase/sphingolipid hydroxylase (fatty acid hydroxylase superfamily)
MFRSHLVSFFIWVNVRQLDAVKTHCGWVFPYDPCHLIPYYGGSLFHDYHHKSFVWNYASRFVLIDQIFGTYKIPANPLDMSPEEYQKRLPSVSDPYKNNSNDKNK